MRSAHTVETISFSPSSQSPLADGKLEVAEVIRFECCERLRESAHGKEHNLPSQSQIGQALV